MSAVLACEMVGAAAEPVAIAIAVALATTEAGVITIVSAPTVLVNSGF